MNYRPIIKWAKNFESKDDVSYIYKFSKEEVLCDRDECGRTALHILSEKVKDDIDIVFLIQLDEINENYWCKDIDILGTPLDYLVMNNSDRYDLFENTIYRDQSLWNIADIRALKNDNINKILVDGKTPLYNLCKNLRYRFDDKKKISLFIEEVLKRDDLNFPKTKSGKNPFYRLLQFIATSNDIEIDKSILSNKNFRLFLYENEDDYFLKDFLKKFDVKDVKKIFGLGSNIRSITDSVVEKIVYFEKVNSINFIKEV